MEVTSGWHVHGARGLALQSRGARMALMKPGCGVKKRPGVGMTGIGEYLLSPAPLDNSAQVHDGDMVAQVPDDGKIV